jgi:hypothetical protein
MLARLNPQTVKYDIGRGGGPATLTNQDIAGALAFVPAGLGREVLEACWWPDGAALRRHALRDAVMAIVMPELMRQSDRLTQSHLDLQLAEAAVMWSGRVKTQEQSREIELLRARLASVRATTWPRNTIEHLPVLAGAVLGELSGRHKCEGCGGRAEVMMGELVKNCPVCRGTGLEPNRNARRAAAIEVDPSEYSRRWRPVYEWLYRELLDAQALAAEQLWRALRW